VARRYGADVAQIRATDGATPAWFVEPTFGQRLTAAVVDGFLVLLVAIALGRLPVTDAVLRGIVVSLTAIYVIGGITLTGRTLGKQLLGIRVASMADGELPALGSAAMRWLVVTAPALVPWVVPSLRAIAPFVTLAVYLPILQPPLHRGLHDRAAGTVVVAKGG
jgi:uncharacterized RDD family membrane protein YckC